MSATLRPPPAPPRTLRFARVAFTGRLGTLRRHEAERAVREAGGRLVSTISRRTTLVVVGMGGWPLLADGRISSRLRRAEDLNRQGARIAIISEAVFLELAGLRETAPPGRKTIAAHEVARLLGVGPQQLQRWEQLSLIRSAAGRFDFQDLVSLQTVVGLIRAGVSPSVIATSLHQLAAILPDTDRPLAQLKIVTDGPGTVLAELGDALISPDGQLYMNFAPPAAPAAETHPLGLRPGDDAIRRHDDDGPPAVGAAQGTGTEQGTGSVVGAARTAPGGPGADEMLSADEWFERAEYYEQTERYAEAAAAYGHVLAIEPAWVEAHFNLGNTLHAAGRLDEALAAYGVAVRHDPLFAAAWYNLADVQEEQERLDDAVASLRTAIAVDPAFADAHFNLALCLEKLGRPSEAHAHWGQYLKLDPRSEWADVARKRQGAR